MRLTTSAAPYPFFSRRGRAPRSNSGKGPRARLLAGGRRALVALGAVLALASPAHAADNPIGAEGEPPAAETLPEIVVTGERSEHVTRLAILPSLSPDLEDVIVRGVVRRDFELTGMFDVVSDDQAPGGTYGFNDPVDVRAWRKVGAEVIVKLAARKEGRGKVRIYGLCYFPSVGRAPVYEKTLVVRSDQVRATAHRITDALLGAITGRNGGFSSRLAFSAPYGRNPAIYTIDADGHSIRARTSPSVTSIAPLFSAKGGLLYLQSRKYSPFRLMAQTGKQAVRVPLPFQRSVYSAAYSPNGKRLAVAVASTEGSTLYAGDAGGKVMVRTSTTDVATHPVFSPSGRLAWAGGPSDRGPQRIYVAGRPISPKGFSAAAPTFCDTEDGLRVVYAVSVGGGQDLFMSDSRGKQLTRLTQGAGSSSYPACSPDGRLIAYFSKKSGQQGLYVQSIKNLRAQRISRKVGQSLSWAALP